MTIKTGFEIFKSFWLIEPQAALNYLDVWEQFRQKDNNMRFRVEEQNAASFDKQKFFAIGGNVVTAPVDLWSQEAKNFKGFAGAETVIIPLDGPLMKNDYCGWAGTGTLLNFFKLADSTDSVKRIILLADSPGGTVDGTQQFADAVANSKKETIAVITGMCCSACYWIVSGCSSIYATSSTDIVGSIGTMVSWYDRTAYLEQNGIVLREFYATKSTDKNKAYREANKGNEKLLVQSMLNPLNNEFVSSIEKNRAGKINPDNEDVLTGKTYVGKDALKYGLIDGISSLDNILSQPAKQKQKSNSLIMKNFKLVLAAAGLASVYEEGKFFGLTEDQLEKVEAAMQKQADDAVTAQEEHARMVNDLATANSNLKLSNDSLAQANETVKTLKAEIETLKKEDGATGTGVTKESDETGNPVPETSVDKWFKNIPK